MNVSLCAQMLILSMMVTVSPALATEASSPGGGATPLSTQTPSPPPGGGGHGGGLRQACKADVQTFCSDVEPGQGRIISCLKEHADEVSAPCKAAMAHAAERHDHHQGDVGGDDGSGKDLSPGGPGDSSPQGNSGGAVPSSGQH